MGKAKREEKRARRAVKGTAEEQQFLEQDRRTRRQIQKRKWTVGLIPAVVIVLAAACHFALDDSRAAGLVLLIGGVIWFLYGLGMLGSSIPPRDRGPRGAAPIQFGRK